MIEKTRRLISRSKEPLRNGEKVEKEKGESDVREEIGVLRRMTCEEGKKKGNHKRKLLNSPHRDMRTASKHWNMSGEKMINGKKSGGKDYK